ncbi:hypothetical protein [Desulfotomaculum copahuensis]|uniref:Uncharacterized protein n=1 Tax=Desulfotomaculum copahuensis TaxID=1838280 RepID=A0A1B7LCJ5_9FIRM|nr:hypothetical protein [Desulfotomaculum copahuensis]OAT80416.1 hypothetical protein A6M21_00635 [Desulfotomaculum copahuensis]
MSDNLLSEENFFARFLMLIVPGILCSVNRTDHCANQRPYGCTRHTENFPVFLPMPAPIQPDAAVPMPAPVIYYAPPFRKVLFLSINTTLSF